MNEFQAKKLGEVLAFCEAGEEIVSKGEKALESVMVGHIDTFTTSLKEQEQQIHEMGDSFSVSDIVHAKAAKTKKKLLAMAQMYIGDEWDNPVELMEWFGFFEGGAIVHWRLVEGIASVLDNKKLHDLSQDGLE